MTQCLHPVATWGNWFSILNQTSKTFINTLITTESPTFERLHNILQNYENWFALTEKESIRCTVVIKTQTQGASLPVWIFGEPNPAFSPVYEEESLSSAWKHLPYKNTDLIGKSHHKNPVCDPAIPHIR